MGWVFVMCVSPHGLGVRACALHQAMARRRPCPPPRRCCPRAQPSPRGSACCTWASRWAVSSPWAPSSALRWWCPASATAARWTTISPKCTWPRALASARADRVRACAGGGGGGGVCPVRGPIPFPPPPPCLWWSVPCVCVWDRGHSSWPSFRRSLNLLCSFWLSVHACVSACSCVCPRRVPMDTIPAPATTARAAPAPAAQAAPMHDHVGSPGRRSASNSPSLGAVRAPGMGAVDSPARLAQQARGDHPNGFKTRGVSPLGAPASPAASPAGSPGRAAPLATRPGANFRLAPPRS
jgi:hypothetical protein